MRLSIKGKISKFKTAKIKNEKKKIIKLFRAYPPRERDKNYF